VARVLLRRSGGGRRGTHLPVLCAPRSRHSRSYAVDAASAAHFSTRLWSAVQEAAAFAQQSVRARRLASSHSLAQQTGGAVLPCPPERVCREVRGDLLARSCTASALRSRAEPALPLAAAALSASALSLLVVLPADAAEGEFTGLASLPLLTSFASRERCRRSRSLRLPVWLRVRLSANLLL